MICLSLSAWSPCQVSIQACQPLHARFTTNMTYGTLTNKKKYDEVVVTEGCYWFSNPRERSSLRPQRNAVDSAEEKPKGIERSDQRTSDKETQTKHPVTHAARSLLQVFGMGSHNRMLLKKRDINDHCSLGVRPKRLYDNQVPPIAIAIIATHAFDQIWSNLCLHAFVRIQACPFTSNIQAPRKTVNHG